MSKSHVDTLIPSKLSLCFALVLAHRDSVLLPQPLTLAGKIALELLLPKCKEIWLRHAVGKVKECNNSQVLNGCLNAG